VQLLAAALEVSCDAFIDHEFVAKSVTAKRVTAKAVTEKAKQPRRRVKN
jgi:hypothetical protein